MLQSFLSTCSTTHVRKQFAIAVSLCIGINIVCQLICWHRSTERRGYHAIQCDGVGSYSARVNTTNDRLAAICERAGNRIYLYAACTASDAIGDTATYTSFDWKCIDNVGWPCAVVRIVRTDRDTPLIWYGVYHDINVNERLFASSTNIYLCWFGIIINVMISVILSVFAILVINIIAMLTWRAR